MPVCVQLHPGAERNDNECLVGLQVCTVTLAFGIFIFFFVLLVLPVLSGAERNDNESLVGLQVGSVTLASLQIIT
jgi:hypothetical protein